MNRYQLWVRLARHLGDDAWVCGDWQMTGFFATRAEASQRCKDFDTTHTRVEEYEIVLVSTALK